MHPRFPAAGRFLEALRSIRRDLAHAVWSLFKERTFTLVCVVSLGIGMGAFVALVTFNRAVGAPARGINTDGLTELLVLPVGPLRARAGVWALERWSYPDYQALRDSQTSQRCALRGDGRRHADRLRLAALRASRAGGAEFVTTQVTRVGETFLETIGAPLLRGRTLSTAEDGIMAAPVAVISEPLAKKLFPGTEPIGERVSVTIDESREEEFAIVGVTGDFATSQLTTERPQILPPLPEVSGGTAKVEGPTPTVHLIARGAPGDEARLKSALGIRFASWASRHCRMRCSRASSPDRSLS